MQSTFDERLGLAWLAKVRIIILTFLLGIQLVIARLTPSTLPVRSSSDAIVLLWYAISVFYLLLLSLWQEHRIQSLLQVLTDLALVSLVVYATGGVDSSLNFLYPLVIIVACIMLPNWPYSAAALAFILYGTVLELTYFEVIPSYSTTHPGLSTLQAIIFVNLFSYLTVAYLAGLLANKLRQADVNVSAPAAHWGKSPGSP